MNNVVITYDVSWNIFDEFICSYRFFNLFSSDCVEQILVVTHPDS